MKKQKKQKKKVEIRDANNSDNGTILLRTVAVSAEKRERILEKLRNLECDISVVVEKCEIVEFEETYFGLCPYCRQEIYTRDTCPECGHIINFW